MRRWCTPDSPEWLFEPPRIGRWVTPPSARFHKIVLDLKARERKNQISETTPCSVEDPFWKVHHVDKDLNAARRTRHLAHRRDHQHRSQCRHHGRIHLRLDRHGRPVRRGPAPGLRSRSVLHLEQSRSTWCSRLSICCSNPPAQIDYYQAPLGYGWNARKPGWHLRHGVCSTGGLVRDDRRLRQRRFDAAPDPGSRWQHPARFELRWAGYLISGDGCGLVQRLPADAGRRRPRHAAGDLGHVRRAIFICRRDPWDSSALQVQNLRVMESGHRDAR